MIILDTIDKSLRGIVDMKKNIVIHIYVLFFY